MAACLHGKQLNQQEIHYIADNARDWALMNGLSNKPDKSPEGQNWVHFFPFSLFPSVVPRPMLQQAADCMTDFNTVMYRLAQDHQFLEQTLSSVIKQDSFISKLWDIYTTVRDEGTAQPISLDLFRNDFMLHVRDRQMACSTAGVPPSCCLQLKQTELNTISAGCAGLGTVITRVHRYTLDLAGIQYTSNEVPDNNPIQGFAAGMEKAWQLYGNPKAVILFLVSDEETNVLDQRWLEFEVHQLNRHIRVVRATLLDVHDKGCLSKDKTFFLNDREVAVVYLRTGYSDESYSSDKEWSARLLMERSRAIKCPTVQSQLSGCKKVQQALARPGAVERFLPDPSAVQRVRSTFAGLYTLEQGSEGDESVKMAIAHPENYVLKPQREGGGHNLYGSEMKAFLEKVGSTPQREAYILMDRLFPLSQFNYLVKAGRSLALEHTDGELGIFGVHIGEGDKEIVNRQSGHLIRTKLQGTDEGGVMTGSGVLDSPFLVDV